MGLNGDLPPPGGGNATHMSSSGAAHDAGIVLEEVPPEPPGDGVLHGYMALF